MTKNISDEIAKLKDNIAAYTVAKKDEYVRSVDDLITQVENSMKQMNEQAKKNAAEELDYLKAQYRRLEDKTEEEQKEIYNSVLQKIANLNEKIQKEISSK